MAAKKGLFVSLAPRKEYDARLVSEAGLDGERMVGVDVDVLADVLLPAQSEPSSPSTLRFNLFSDVDVVLRTQVITPHPLGVISWQGVATDTPGTTAVLSVVDLEQAHPNQLTLSGSVSHAGESYSLRTVAPGVVHIVRSQVLDRPYCHTVNVSPGTPEDDDVYDEIDPTQLEKEPVVIKSVMLYPSGSTNPEHSKYKELNLKSVPDDKAIMAFATAAVEDTNRVFRNSNINARLNMIELKPVVLSTSSFRASIFNVNVLGFLDSDTSMQTVIHNALNEAGADVAVIIMPLVEGQAYGGASAIPEPPTLSETPLTHRVLAFTQALDKPTFNPVGNHVLAHELGHLLGAKHDRFTLAEQDELNTLSYPYGYVCGYIPDDKHFCTVMGYPYHLAEGHIGRIPYYSEARPKQPVSEVGGRPIGEALSPDKMHAADAAPFLRKSVHVVSRYNKAPADLDKLVELDIQVEPRNSGFVQRGALGPLAPDTHLTVEAIGRAGFSQFKSWQLDGKALAETSRLLTLPLAGGQSQGAGKPKMMRLVANFELVPLSLTWDVTGVGVPDAILKEAKAKWVVSLKPASADIGEPVVIHVAANDEQLFHDYAIARFRVNGTVLEYWNTFVSESRSTHIEIQMRPRDCRLRRVAIPSDSGRILAYSFPQGTPAEIAGDPNPSIGVGIVEEYGTFTPHEGATATATFEYWGFSGRKHDMVSWIIDNPNEPAVVDNAPKDRIEFDKVTPGTFVTLRCKDYEKAVKLTLISLQDPNVDPRLIKIAATRPDQDTAILFEVFSHSDILYFLPGTQIVLTTYSTQPPVSLKFWVGEEPGNLEESHEFVIHRDMFIIAKRE